MDKEGEASRTPEKQTVGTVTASHKMLSLEALSSSLNAGTAKGGCLGRGEAFGCPPAVCPPERPRPFTHHRFWNWKTFRGNFVLQSQRVSNAALANAALVLSSKNWKKYSRWGAASKNNSKKPWALCRRAGIDAALVRVQFVLRGCTHHRK